MELLADLAQGCVQLGREQQHGQPGLKRQVTAGELNPDRRRDERDPDHRAQLEHERRHERDPQRRHRLPAVALADVGEHLLLDVLAAVRAQRLETADDVEEVRAEQGEGAEPPPRLGLRPLADEDHEHDQDRDRDGEDDRRHGIEDCRVHEHRERHDAREDQLGEVAGEIRLERVDTLDRARGEITGSDVRRSPPGREHEQVLDEPPAQLGHDSRGTEPAGELEAGADERPAREHGGERDQRSFQRAQRDTVGRRARHDVAEQPGLRQDQAALSDAEAGDQREVRPGCAALTEQPSVDRCGHVPRPLGQAPAAGPVVGSGAPGPGWPSRARVCARCSSTATGVIGPSKSSRPSRWRNTQYVHA